MASCLLFLFLVIVSSIVRRICKEKPFVENKPCMPRNNVINTTTGSVVFSQKLCVFSSRAELIWRVLAIDTAGDSRYNDIDNKMSMTCRK